MPHLSSRYRKHGLPSCPIIFRSSLSTNVCLNHEPGGLLELQRREKYICITLSFGSIFFQLLLPFVFVSSSLFSPSLPEYDLCAGSGSGTFSAALACGYFRSVAFQVVHSTLPVSDVVALFKRNEVFPAQTRSNALNQESFINCWTTLKEKRKEEENTCSQSLFKFFKGSV